MKVHFRNTLTIFCVSVAVMTLSAELSAQSQAPTETVQVDKGVAQFDARTNIPGVKVHGKSESLRANVRLRRGSGQLVLDEIEAWLPIKSLETGMGIRDNHLHNSIFKMADGRTPDLRFTGSNLTCPSGGGREVKCNISGSLTIRGVKRPFTLAAKIREQGGSVITFRVVGEGSVKLSDYDIEQPSYLGVTIKDSVKLKFELTAKEVGMSAANSGGTP